MILSAYKEVFTCEPEYADRKAYRKDWWVEWGVVIQKDSEFLLDWSNTCRMVFTGCDLEKARGEALALMSFDNSLLWYDWDKHWSVGTHKTTITSKNAYLWSYERGTSTWAFVTVRWSV